MLKIFFTVLLIYCVIIGCGGDEIVEVEPVDDHVNLIHVRRMRGKIEIELHFDGIPRDVEIGYYRESSSNIRPARWRREDKIIFVPCYPVTGFVILISIKWHSGHRVLDAGCP